MLHPESGRLIIEFRKKYVSKGMKILDVGGINKMLGNNYLSFKPFFHECEYHTLNLKDADIIVKGYKWPIKDKTYNVVITSSCFEHDKFFWKTLKNMVRVLKKGGYICIIVPSKGKIHNQHDTRDYYRFLPDSLELFAEIMGIELIESSISDTYWGDLMGVYKT